jgi:hypothetical protein
MTVWSVGDTTPPQESHMEYGMHPLDPTDDYNPDDYPAPPAPKPSTDLGEVLFSIFAAAGIMLAMWFWMLVL